MAFLGSVKNECERLNRKNRNVREHRGSFNAADYWRNAAGGNFIITGGTDTQRNNLLASALISIRRAFRGPIIIINGNREFESLAISMASRGQTGKLIVSSGNYRNYDLFSGMPPANIRELIENLAQQKNISDIGALGDYTDAFIHVLNRKYRPGLHSMLALARESDESIAAFGHAQHVDTWNLDVIKNATQAGRYFRRLLNEFANAFGEVQSKSATGYNIASVSAEDQICLLWSRSAFQHVFNMELAAELKLLIARRRNFILIINDTALEKKDGLAEVTARAKNLTGSRTGICCRNVMSWSDVDNCRDQLLGNTPSMIVLNSGYEDSADQRAVLERFGKYMHFEPNTGVGGRPGLIHFPGEGAKHIGMTNYEMLRVRVEDMQRFSVAARGHMGDTIGLYGGIAGY